MFSRANRKGREQKQKIEELESQLEKYFGVPIVTLSKLFCYSLTELMS